MPACGSSLKLVCWPDTTDFGFAGEIILSAVDAIDATVPIAVTVASDTPVAAAKATPPIAAPTPVATSATAPTTSATFFSALAIRRCARPIRPKRYDRERHRPRLRDPYARPC